MVKIDMEMPESCFKCPISRPEKVFEAYACKINGYINKNYNQRAERCPLIEVKE